MDKKNKQKPLADRMRPKNLAGFLGQEDILAPNKILFKSILADNIPSLILWGPPGSGKTTLAKIIAGQSKAMFRELRASIDGKKVFLKIISDSQVEKKNQQKLILFIDEIHRWNKAQQDALLPYVENGTIILIGATTENPSFELRNALLSRCRVLVLKSLSQKNIERIIKKTLNDEVNGLAKFKLKINKKAISFLASLSNGDARIALSVLEYASSTNNTIDRTTIKEALQKNNLLYDKDGEEHYNLISALHKSLRGSDENASLYWLSRMLAGGESPLYIARRLVRFASEDIGLANSRALEQSVAAYQACHYIGMPECGVVLSQVVVYLSRCKKSNSLYTAYNLASKDVKRFGSLSVPMHIRNAPSKLMKKLGYAKGYKYSPDHNYEEKQSYLPEKLKNRNYLLK